VNRFIQVDLQRLYVGIPQQGDAHDARWLRDRSLAIAESRAVDLDERLAFGSVPTFGVLAKAKPEPLVRTVERGVRKVGDA
jgi:hypothetical protein